MVRIYYLETEIIDNAEVVKGIEYIHGGVLGVEGILRKLTQDTTEDEHNGLAAIAVSWREATADEILQLEAIIAMTYQPLPDPDYDKACGLLARSPPAITMVEAWELLRLFGKRLGYRPQEKGDR